MELVRKEANNVAIPCTNGVRAQNPKRVAKEFQTTNIPCQRKELHAILITKTPNVPGALRSL